jgi:D-proline reductase (dithiol) PrdB
MAHLHDIPPRSRASIERLECPVFDETRFASGPPLNRRRVAVISTAGLHHRDDRRFAGDSTDFRSISQTTSPDDILMSHVSVNFDRTGFQQDIDTVLPMNRLADLAFDGQIGSVATTHYSFMGANDPVRMQPGAAQVAGMLKDDRVDAVLLVPV